MPCRFSGRSIRGLTLHGLQVDMQCSQACQILAATLLGVRLQESADWPLASTSMYCGLILNSVAVLDHISLAFCANF